MISKNHLIIILSFSIFILICEWIGNIIISVEEEDKRKVIKKNSSPAILLGIFVTISFYASIKTYLISVFTVFNLLLIGYLIFKNKSVKISKFNPSFSTCLIVIVFVISSIFKGIKFYFFNAANNNFSQDIFFYSNISNFLNKYSIETSYVNNFLYNKESGLMPYHYFDIWMGSFFGFITKSPTTEIYIYGIYVVFSVLFIFIFISKEIIKSNLFSVILISILCSDISFSLSWILNRFSIWYNNFYMPYMFSFNSKMIVLSPFLLLFLKNYKKYSLSFSSVMFFSVIFLSFPTIGAPCAIVVALIEANKFFFNKKINFGAFVLFFIASYYFIFYAINSNSSTINISFNFDFDYFNRFVISYFKYIIVSIPFLAILFFIRTKIESRLVLYLIFSSIFCAALLEGFFEGKQFFNNLFCILLTIVCLHIFLDFSNVYRSIFISFFLLIFFLSVDLIYLKRANKTFSSPKYNYLLSVPFDEISEIGVETYDSVFRKNNPFFNYSSINMLLHPIYTRRFYQSSSLGMVYKQYSKNISLRNLQKYRQSQDLFYNFASRNSDRPVDSIIITYLKKYKINHVVQVNGFPLPPFLRKYICEKYKLNDNGDSLLFLKTRSY